MAIKKENYRWGVLVLLFFATTINYIDRQVIGMLKPFIAEELGWGEAGYGYIVTGFQAAYAVGLLLSGRILDKVGTKIGYAVAVTLWSLAGVLHAAARSVFSFGAARFFLGLGESANFPAAVKTVAEWFPPKERALATGLFNSGSNIGAIVAPVIVTSFTIAYGWQWAFITTGALGFIWVLLWVLFYRVPCGSNFLPVNTADIYKKEKQTNTVPWKTLFRYKQTIAISLSRFVTDWVWWFFLFWTPDYLNKRYGVNLTEMILPLIIIYSVAGVGGIGGGWLSGFFIRKGKTIDYSRKTTVLICGLIVLPIIAASEINNIWVVTGIISLATAAHQGWASNIFTIVSDIYPGNTVATMTGLSGFAGAVGGALAATFVGFVLEITNDYFFIFLIAGSMYLLAWAILKVLIPEIKPLEIDLK